MSRASLIWFCLRRPWVPLQIGVDGARWKLFTLLSAIGWRICPEPHRSILQARMPTWADLAKDPAP